MFESVSADAMFRQDRTRFRGALPVSLLVHGIALVAWPIAGAWHVTFPTEWPAMMVRYTLVEPAPPPPPPPPPPAPPKREQSATLVRHDAVPASDVILAPTVIPDEILPVTRSIVHQGAVVGGVEGGVIGGVVGGTENGVAGGEIGGTDEGVVGSVDDGRIVVKRDRPLMMVPLSQVYPIYPERARMQRWEDEVVVRYVIGTDGRVKEVTVLAPATRKIFNEATVHAIRHWRFRPMIRDGEAREVVHELTIYYRLEV